jgi:predicted dehydrogenase
MADPLGLGILGCAHLPHAMSYARAATGLASTRLVAVFDESAAVGHQLADRFRIPFVAAADELVALPGLDAVVVCSETSSHRRLVELAANAGLHVLCEKPIATSLVDATAMIEACDRAAVQLHIAFVTRFYPVVQRVRHAILEGTLGEIIGVVGGNRGRPPLPPTYAGWITDPARAGGGALIDHSVHVTDVMRHVTGLEVAAVGAEVDSRFWNAGVDDMAVLSLWFEGGAIGSVDPSWSVPANNPWHYDFYLRLLGTDGALAISDTTEAINVVGEVGRPGQVLVPFGVDIDAELLDAFVRSIQAGRRLDPCADGVDGIRALEVALAGYEAAATMSRIRLPRSERR